MDHFSSSTSSPCSNAVKFHTPTIKERRKKKRRESSFEKAGRNNVLGEKVPKKANVTLFFPLHSTAGNKAWSSKQPFFAGTFLNHLQEGKKEGKEEGPKDLISTKILRLRNDCPNFFPPAPNWKNELEENGQGEWRWRSKTCQRTQCTLLMEKRKKRRSPFSSLSFLFTTNWMNGGRCLIYYSYYYFFFSSSTLNE